MTNSHLIRSGDVALLIDWENLKRSLQDEEMRPNVTAVREMAERFGRLVIARAYADWSDSWHRNDPTRLHDAGIEPVFVPTKVSMRRGNRERLHNSVDVKLTADCVEFNHRYPDIRTVVLVSGDADFVHAINVIRPYGRQVVVIGVSWSVANRLIETADEYIEYDKEIVQNRSVIERLPEADRQKLEAALQLIPEIVASSRYPGRALPKWVRRELTKRVKGFNERDFGFDQFRALLQLAETRNLVTLVTTDDMVEWVHLPQSKAVAKQEADLVNFVPELIRFANDLEKRYDFVSFNFLINRLLEARELPVTRTQLAGILADAIEDELFIRGIYNRTNSDGNSQQVRTIELDRNHPIVRAALSDDDQLAHIYHSLAESPDEPLQYQQLAERYAELGLWSQALENQEIAIELAPDQLEFRTRRIVMLGQAGDIQKAIESGRQLAELHPGDPRPLGALAQVYCCTSNHRTAIPYYRQALALVSPDDHQLRLEYSLPIVRCYLQVGSLDKAHDFLLEIVAWGSDNPAVQILWAELEQQLETRPSNGALGAIKETQP